MCIQFFHIHVKCINICMHESKHKFITQTHTLIRDLYGEQKSLHISLFIYLLINFSYYSLFLSVISDKRLGIQAQTVAMDFKKVRRRFFSTSLSLRIRIEKLKDYFLLFITMMREFPSCSLKKRNKSKSLNNFSF